MSNATTLTRPPARPTVRVKSPAPCATFGDLLQALARCQPGRPDDRLRATYQATAGSDEHNTLSDPYGGFLVPSSMASRFFTKVLNTGELLSKVLRLPADLNSFSTNLPTLDETSRADGSRFGGVQMFWRAETQTIDASRFKLGSLNLRHQQLFGLCYATNLLLKNAPLLESVITTAFSGEASFLGEDAMVNGTGVGMLEGILKAAATITVSKETLQAADTLQPENFNAMWRRCWGASRKNAVWLVNPDADAMIANADWSDAPGIYKPAGDAFPGYSTIHGRPVVPSEYCATLGDFGDVLLFDPTQYALLDTGEVKIALSQEVRFHYDQTAFLIMLEIAGMPAWRSALTPKNSATTVSPYVALEARG